MKKTYVYANESYGLTPYSMMLGGRIRVRFDSEAELLCAALVLSIEKIPIWGICGLIHRYTSVDFAMDSFETKKAVETALKRKIHIARCGEYVGADYYRQCRIPWEIIFGDRILYYEEPFKHFFHLREKYAGEFIICDDE